MRGEALRWGILAIALLVASGGIFAQYQNTRPCVHPISYSIGAADARFGISNSTLIKAMKEAAMIWNAAAGKTVLTYDPSAVLKVNLVYDEREATAKLSNQIASEESRIDRERAAIADLRAEYLAAQTAYNQAVNAVNARGGATKKEAAALEPQRTALSAQAETLNSRVADFNQRVAVLNAKVAEFNKTAGHTYQQGQYVRDAAGERINIFAFIDSTQLTRVLAHEFGHALGLEHNDDPDAIMYAKNESGNLTPTAADLAALRALCGS